MALAWSWQYFLFSFTRTRRGRRIAGIIARFSAFWLKYFDPYLVRREASLDAASGVFFLGQKADAALDDRALIAGYRGGMNR
jgi:hypothetical protein